MDNKIFLQGFNSKKSVNTSEGLNVRLVGKRRLLPTTDMSETISQSDVYNEERKNCNKIRLTCQVNPVCTNVLFNSITEIVKDEGSSEVSFLNYKVLSGKIANDEDVISDKIYYKNNTISGWVNNNFGTLELIRDTQITNDEYVYHCGKDIFNNHLIRSNTFKAICSKGSDTTDIANFNTIRDDMRNAEGGRVKERIYYPVDSGFVNKGRTPTKLHVYKSDDIYSFEDCVENRLINNFTGWVGFKNKAKISTYKDFWNDDFPMQINKPIMYMNGGDFVDMYPDRSLYSFVPKYNPYRNRIEKNWNYCLTYPSSSITEPFTDIIQPNNNSLKVLYFNENTVSDGGVKQLVIYSIAKHGLSKGDYVNIYNTISGETSLILQNAEVTTIVNDYIFIVFSDVQISKNWMEVSSEDSTININDDTYVLNGLYYIKNGEEDGYKYYVIEDKYVNLDDDAQELSYKKVVSGIECEYYVRIFSKIPNFKFASADTSSEYALYKDNGKVIDEYQDSKYDFESHPSRLAFAKNIYSDDIGEIVFTDDIDISNLKDNLGRPLSSIYLTFVKNNKGYKEWYGFGYNTENPWSETMITSENVEFSHCFGKITCGIETSEETRFNNDINSINRINNNTYDKTTPRGYKVFDSDDTEIDFGANKHFYGDLCYYDGYHAIERVIQPILHRFNTAQRESKDAACNKIYKGKDAMYFEKFYHDEIRSDDYDTASKFRVATQKYDELCNEKHEGYYYNPHYEIKIKSFDKLQTAMPDFLSVVSLVIRGETTKFTTLQYHYLSIGDKTVIYDKTKKKYYHCITVKGKDDDYHTYTFKAYDENGKFITPNEVFKNDEGGMRPLREFKVFKMDNLNIPSYAQILKDGTCRLIWRNIVNNGLNMNDDTIEEYPFTNGAFYINKRVDIYVKRQDPYEVWGLYSYGDIRGAELYVGNEDNYVKDKEIEC